MCVYIDLSPVPCPNRLASRIDLLLGRNASLAQQPISASFTLSQPILCGPFQLDSYIIAVLAYGFKYQFDFAVLWELCWLGKFAWTTVAQTQPNATVSPVSFAAAALSVSFLFANLTASERQTVAKFHISKNKQWNKIPSRLCCPREKVATKMLSSRPVRGAPFQRHRQ
jgi:hypothetical protein